MRALLAQLESFTRKAGEDVTVVFDGRPFDLPESGSVEVVFASSADDAIVQALAADPDAAAVTVVTSDAELADRARATGAGVTGAGGFRRRLDRAGD